MINGICLIAYAPLRSEPDHRSEMVNQLLFGEGFDVIETRGGWLYIEMHYDHYRGWISGNQVQIMEESARDILRTLPNLVATDNQATMTDTVSKAAFPVSAGTTFLCSEDREMAVGRHRFRYHGDLAPANELRTGKIRDYAYSFLNVPYIWGGRSVFGMDCSGLVQVVFKLAGIRIPRDSREQARKGESIHLIHETKVGDLLFFDNEEGEINHVGLMLSEDHIIHAHGKVRVDKVDHHGIFDAGQKRYTHKLRLIKRICGE